MVQQTSSGFEVNEHINVAAPARFAPRHRPENPEIRSAMPSGDGKNLDTLLP
jgi:hypothetical protein